VSGILLFQDAKGNNRVLTMDKAGYGYLMNQGDLGGFAKGDPGNIFAFAAASKPCTGKAAGCDRITSMAYYNDTLYYWPYHERLVGLKSYDSTAAIGGTGTITSSGTTVTGTNTNFKGEIVPGCTISAGGQRVKIVSGTATTLTVSPAFSPDVTNAKFSYNGLLINPITATIPDPAETGYPGGSIVITSNGNAPGSGIVWGLGTAKGVVQNVRGPGTLYAYDAKTLVELWSSPDPFTASSFALPTVVNGNVYIPTYDQGILVYKGTRQ
jgi:hypothetical protein